MEMRDQLIRIDKWIPKKVGDFPAAVIQLTGLKRTKQRLFMA